MRSPTQRSSALLREQGYLVDIVEHYNAYAHVRRDLFGWADLVALHPQKQGILAVQTTTGANLAARVEKARQMASFRLWIAAGGVVEFHGWRKIKTGAKQRTWHPSIVRFAFADLV